MEQQIKNFLLLQEPVFYFPLQTVPKVPTDYKNTVLSDDGEYIVAKAGQKKATGTITFMLILIVGSFVVIYLVVATAKKKKTEELEAEKQKEIEEEKKKFCSYCGTKIQESDNVCPNCGSRLN